MKHTAEIEVWAEYNSIFDGIEGVRYKPTMIFWIMCGCDGEAVTLETMSKYTRMSLKVASKYLQRMVVAGLLVERNGIFELSEFARNSGLAKHLLRSEERFDDGGVGGQ